VTISVDLEARRVVAGVRDLAGEGQQRSIGLTGNGLARLWIGQERHRRLQDTAHRDDPDYHAEVPVHRELEVDGWTLEIRGRADGVVERDGRVERVEEIKTVHLAVEMQSLFFSESLERFRQQLRVYAYLLSTPDAPATAELVLADIASEEVRRRQVRWSANAVEAWLRRAVHRLVSEARHRAERVARRHGLAAELPFPFPELRSTQKEIVTAVDESLSEGRQLLVSAPTGTGKTAAVLHPALRWALAHGKRLLYLTPKTLQQQMAVRTVEAMQTGSHAADTRLKSLQLRAKTKMCANAEMICHPELCPYAAEYGLKLVRTGLLSGLKTRYAHLDPDTLFSEARNAEVCPFEVSLDMLEAMDVVVCDYNYVFDPTIGLASLLDDGELSETVLVVDEAHNLVERSRGYYSPEIDADLIDAARAHLELHDAKVYRALLKLVAELDAEIRRVVDDAFGLDGTGDAEGALDPTTVADLRLAFDGAMLQYFLYKRERDLWLADDPVMELFLALVHFHRVLQLDGDELVHLVSRQRPGDRAARIFCRDASRFIAPILEESAGVVAMSATLEPFEFYRDLLGFDATRLDTLSLGSPFPASNRLVLAIDTVDTTYRRRAASYDAIASIITRLAHPEHNSLVLFPSYAFLRHVAERLPPSPHRRLIQQPGSSDLAQRELLTALAEDQPTLVLAVLGGIFAEGVDYPGRMLSEVMVVSPGLPQVSTERQLLKEFFQERYEHGFSYAYLIPGMTRVIQAAGRLIRSADDCGVIVLLGKRFTDIRYARLLPKEWTGGDATTLVLDDPAAAVATFFDGEPDPPAEHWAAAREGPDHAADRPS
jgi:DNA excision repair protein ERCC-2